MLAKEAATMDYLSGGRLEFGLGAGWIKSEYEAAGMAFDGDPSTRWATAACSRIGPPGASRSTVSASGSWRDELSASRSGRTASADWRYDVASDNAATAGIGLSYQN